MRSKNASKKTLKYPRFEIIETESGELEKKYIQINK